MLGDRAMSGPGDGKHFGLWTLDLGLWGFGVGIQVLFWRVERSLEDPGGQGQGALLQHIGPLPLSHVDHQESAALDDRRPAV